jgi:hypothetical protein
MVYHEVRFQLTKPQAHKLAIAHKKKTGLSLRLNSSKISPTGIPLMLTVTEFKKINSGKTHDIRISAARIKQGGFLPALLAAIPTIAGVIGGISGLTGIASNIKNMVQGKGATREGIYPIEKLCGKCKGAGFISDLGIPLISPLAKMIGLGAKKKRRRRVQHAGCGGLVLGRQ